MDSDGEDIEFGINSSQGHHSFQNQSFYNFEGNLIENFYNCEDYHLRKAQCPTGLSQIPFEFSNQQLKPEIQKQKNAEGLFKFKHARTKRYIQISRRTKQRYVICKKGNKRQTSLLNINFKTLLSSFLRQYLTFSDVSSYEQQKINQFFQAKANFSAFQKLFGVEQILRNQNVQGQADKKTRLIIKEEHDKIRKFMINKFENGLLISKILANKKMSYENKVSFFKFLSQIRKSCVCPENFKNWKASYSI